MWHFRALTRGLSLERAALVVLGLCVLAQYLLVLGFPHDATAARSKPRGMELLRESPLRASGSGEANLIGAGLRLLTPSSARVMAIPSVRALSKAFDSVNYQLLGVMHGGNGVPRLFSDQPASGPTPDWVGRGAETVVSSNPFFRSF